MLTRLLNSSEDNEYFVDSIVAIDLRIAPDVFLNICVTDLIQNFSSGIIESVFRQ